MTKLIMPDDWDRWDVSPELREKLRDAARELRKRPSRSEEILWQALRNRRLAGRKFRRQAAVGPFILDFYCAEERLAVEVDGPVHRSQQQADRDRQELLEGLGIRFARVTAQQVEDDLPGALETIRAAFRLKTK